MTGPTPTPLLQARGLHAHYALRRDWLGRPQTWMRAVNGVDLDLFEGETLGLVGESGCGKSTLGRTLLGLRPTTAGSVRVHGQDLATQTPAQLKALRRQMQIVFQDPYASLDPRETAGAAVRAGLDLHAIGSPAEREARVAHLFKQVGLAPEMMRRWPHEFSGGQRQRLGIARALALQPKLLVCDEPVSALDVSIQAQILNLLKSLQQQMGLSLLFVSHNLAVVEHMADRVAVMYAGRIVEQASREALFANPRHPYTLALLAAVPTPEPRQRGMALARKVGAQEIKVNGGCGFAGRCPQAQAKCLSTEPPLNTIAPSHQVACWATPSGS